MTPAKTDALIRWYWDRGYSAGQIALLTGLTVNQVISRRRALGLASRPTQIRTPENRRTRDWSDEKRATFMQGIMAGGSYKEIAARVGVHQSYLPVVLRELGWKHNGKLGRGSQWTPPA